MNKGELNTLLIMFVDPNKFSSLFRQEMQNIILNYDQIKNNNVIYFENDIINTTNDISADSKLKNAFCIILSDNFSNFSYEPVVDFKILYHTGTDEGKLKLLRQNSHYKGELKSMEEPEQIYGAIAKAIEDGKFMQEFQSFYDQIPDFNYLLEAKLNLLHQCLTPQGAKAANPDWLQGEANTKFTALKNVNGDDPFRTDYIKALSDLRDELLKEY